MSRPLVLPRAEAEAIIAHARETRPRECCGLLAGKNGEVRRRYPITNIDETNTFYRPEAGELYRAMEEIDWQGLELTAIYHSHPESPARPSARDLSHAFFDEEMTLEMWPGSLYVICSLENPDQPVINAFAIEDKRFAPVEITYV